MGGQANRTIPWCCSMINADKERKERRKLINTMVIPARICLSQVIRILTSCLEKRTGNKSPCETKSGGVEVHQDDPAVVGVPKKLFLPLLLGFQAAAGETSMETSQMLLLSSRHPTPGRSSGQSSFPARGFQQNKPW